MAGAGFAVARPPCPVVVPPPRRPPTVIAPPPGLRPPPFVGSGLPVLRPPTSMSAVAAHAAATAKSTIGMKPEGGGPAPKTPPRRRVKVLAATGPPPSLAEGAPPVSAAEGAPARPEKPAAKSASSRRNTRAARQRALRRVMAQGRSLGRVSDASSSGSDTRDSQSQDGAPPAGPRSLPPPGPSKGERDRAAQANFDAHKGLGREELERLLPRKEDGSLSSIGSILHEARMCVPCCFEPSTIGCENGVACKYCHLQHKRLKNMRRRASKKKMKQANFMAKIRRLQEEEGMETENEDDLQEGARLAKRARTEASKAVDVPLDSRGNSYPSWLRLRGHETWEQPPATRPSPWPVVGPPPISAPPVQYGFGAGTGPASYDYRGSHSAPSYGSSWGAPAPAAGSDLQRLPPQESRPPATADGCAGYSAPAARRGLPDSGSGAAHGDPGWEWAPGAAYYGDAARGCPPASTGSSASYSSNSSHGNDPYGAVARGGPPAPGAHCDPYRAHAYNPASTTPGSGSVVHSSGAYIGTAPASDGGRAAYNADAYSPTARGALPGCGSQDAYAAGARGGPPANGAATYGTGSCSASAYGGGSVTYSAGPYGAPAGGGSPVPGGYTSRGASAYYGPSAYGATASGAGATPYNAAPHGASAGSYGGCRSVGYPQQPQ